MAKGVVKWFNDEKGYGFITPDGETKDLFVHFSAVVTDKPGRKVLKDGQRVTFEAVQGERGLQADNVVCI